MIAFIQVFVIVIIFCYYYGIKNFNYWKKRGVKYEKPIAFFGNHLNVMFLLKQSMAQYAEEIYWKYPEEKIVGSFRSTRPELIIRDPEIAKRILVTDFASFRRRKLFRAENYHGLMKNLFFAEGDVWKLVRQRMTNAFSTGKLKAMFPLVVERAERLQARVMHVASSRCAIDAKDLMARYTVDFIGACGFGIDIDTLSDENSAFRRLSTLIFDIKGRDALVIALQEVFPKTFQNLSFMTRFENEFTILIEKILGQKNHEPSKRNDFIDLLLKYQKKGTIVGESIEKFEPDGTPCKVELEMDMELIAAQVLVFFSAGFETSSSSTSFTLHQLAYNQDIQKKVQQEIDRVLAKHDNKLSYDAIKDMIYLKWTFKEAMRMFPSVGYLNRESVEKYTIPEVNITIDEGVVVLIPLQALHNDPKYFKNPEIFRPERFSSEEFDQNHKLVYMPFGEGSRNCIGALLGLMQSLAGLAAVLSKFTVHPAPNSKRYPTIDTTSHIVQQVLGGLPLLFEERKF